MILILLRYTFLFQFFFFLNQLLKALCSNNFILYYLFIYLFYKCSVCMCELSPHKKLV